LTDPRPRQSSRGDAFEQALDEVEFDAIHGDEDGRVARPNVRAHVDLGLAPGAGGGDRWALALAWTGAGVAPAGPPEIAADQAVPTFPESAEEVAHRLGFTAAMGLNQVHARWRDFVSRFHPDRQPAHTRERASACVAIANALYDQARRERRARR
jgi:hypothetical protein